MKEAAINCERTIIAHHQPTEVTEPGKGSFDFPASFVSSQGPTILHRRLTPTLAMRDDRLNAVATQVSAQRVAVVAAIHDHTHGFLPWSSGTMTAPHADRRECLLDEFDLCRGCRVKVVSQRKTLAVSHHHPLRALAPLGFSGSVAPFFAGAKLPSIKDSLHFSCWRSFSSLRNARQMFTQTSCSSQSRSRRQQVAGEGNSSGKSHQRAPLRRIHKMPSSTLRSFIRGRPPCRCLGGFGSKGRIFSHCASVSNRPYRAIRPPSALLTVFIAHFAGTNYCKIKALYPVLK